MDPIEVELACPVEGCPSRWISHISWKTNLVTSPLVGVNLKFTIHDDTLEKMLQHVIEDHHAVPETES